MDVPTAAVDGINLWWNPVFFNSLDEETQITILAHELWHIAYLHCVRGIGLEQDRYNIAADHVINLMLEEHGYYMDGFPYYRNKKYSKWSTEQVYDDLPPDPSGGGGGIGSDIVPGDSISDQAANDALSAVVGAATIARMTNKAGDIPGEVSLSIEHFLRPVLPWETLLRNFFNDLSEPERTFRRRNRRYNHMYLPGEAEITGLEHLMYGLDISGSISDENILRFNSEVKYIKEEFQPELLTLLTFDTHIRDEYVFEKDDPFNKIVVTGRGGTDLHDLFMRAKKERPSCLVVFTDLCVNIPENPGVPVLWVCIDNWNAEVPYGRLIHIKDNTHVKEGLVAPENFTWGHHNPYQGG